jgi:predicted CXXCH cytochrome family protein
VRKGPALCYDRPNMRRIGLFSTLLLATIAAGAFWAARSDAAAEEGCVSASCHATLLKRTTVHPVADSCGNCHESVATPHPQKGAKTFKLSAEPPALCYNCHDAFGKKSRVHDPVKEGACTTCHDPHASDQPKLLEQPLKELCGTCHSELVEFKYVHGPVSAGDCTACHTPHESDTKALLLRQGDAVCTGCHLDIRDLLKKPDVHPALQGGCTSCHDPHGSAHPKLLAEEGARACYPCHEEIAAKVEKAPVVHGAVLDEKGCANCHSPHASDFGKLLLKQEKEACLGCHEGVIGKDATVLHGPIRDGKCTPCHDPHGGPNAKLLVKEFPADIYVPYTDTEFALCFGCHNRDLLRYRDTSFATNFRDGDKNLHFVHVNNAQKGRSCKLCHEIHGSATPKLMAKTVPFGKWSLPLNFVKTESGGQCSPGCHRPAAYDRSTPGKKPAAPKPTG